MVTQNNTESSNITTPLKATSLQKDAIDNIISNTVIVNAMKSKISLEFRYTLKRIQPIMLFRSCLYIEITLHICHESRRLVFTLNLLYFVINDSFEQIPEIAQQVRLKLVQATTLVLGLISSHSNKKYSITEIYKI